VHRRCMTDPSRVTPNPWIAIAQPEAHGGALLGIGRLMIMYAVAQPETQALNLDEWTRYRSIIDNLSRGPVPQPVYSPRPKKMRRLNTPGPPAAEKKPFGSPLC
jgi:hypothetical protein